jgi:hypothetical protein
LEAGHRRSGRRLAQGLEARSVASLETRLAQGGRRIRAEAQARHEVEREDGRPRRVNFLRLELSVTELARALDLDGA